MSAFKKSQKAMRKPHRERSQPSHRQHLGLLEKKSDYKQRAKNFHNKEKHLQALHKKALQRNPDEFYYKMIHKKLKDGEHWIDNERPEQTMTEAQKRLMQTQDLNYVQMRLQMEKRKLEKLSEVVDLDEKPKNKRTIFVDSKEEAKRVKLSNKPSTQSPEQSDPLIKELRAEKAKRQKEIESRHKRKQELQVIVDKMELQRHLADSSVKRERIQKESKNSAAIYKWQRIRKK